MPLPVGHGSEGYRVGSAISISSVLRQIEPSQMRLGRYRRPMEIRIEQIGIEVLYSSPSRAIVRPLLLPF